MKIKTFALLILVAVLLVVSGWFWLVERAEAPSVSAFVFDSQTGESISVSFNNENQTAVMNGEGYDSLVFKQTISASGARYENEAEGLILWNKGNDITLYKGEEIIFTGTTGNTTSDSDNEVVGESENVQDENTDATGEIETNRGIFDSKWVWLYTDLAVDGRVNAPEGDHFVLALNKDGSLSSTTDCNTMGGQFVIDGEVLSFGELYSTKMYCMDSKEQVYSGQLALVNSYEINGEILKFNLNRDFGVMYFARK